MNRFICLIISVALLSSILFFITHGSLEVAMGYFLAALRIRSELEKKRLHHIPE